MDYKILRPITSALEQIISMDDLKKQIGLLGLSDIPTFKKYLINSNRVNLLDELILKEEGFFVINDDEFMNDHILLGIKSQLVENENNILFFLLPSVIEYENETLENIEEMKAFFTLPTNQNAFFEQFQICLIKCKIIQLTREKAILDNNLN